MGEETQQPVSAQVVGNAFALQYYKILHHSPERVHLFYQDASKVGRQEDDGSMTITTTMKAIGEKILSIDYGQFSAVTKTVDAQESYDGGVHVLVTGYVIGKDTTVRNFTQSFFLAPRERGYYVLNDMLRYVDNAGVNSALVNDGVAPIAAAEPVPFVVNHDCGPHSKEHASGEVYNPPENGDASQGKAQSIVSMQQHGFRFGLVEFNDRSDVMREENHSVHDEEDDATPEEEDRFLCKLKDKCIFDYIYKHMTLLYVNWFSVELRDDVDPVMEGMDLLGGVKHYSYSDLKLFTNSLNEQTNLVCKTRYGRLFHGKIGKTDVLVKTWDPVVVGDILKTFDTRRIADELSFLRHPVIKSHPNVVELVGYSCEKKLAVVYKGRRPNCLLVDAIESDEFGWEDRIRVARQIASVVKTFHDHGHVHRGLEPECFTMTIHGEEGHYVAASYDFNLDYFNGWWRSVYEERDMCAHDYIYEEPAGLEKLKKEDVFGFGYLLQLIFSKSTRWEESPEIHWSFKSKDREIACKKIEELVLDCFKILDLAGGQPSIDQVVEILEELNVNSCSEGVVNEEDGDKLSSEKMAREDVCLGNWQKENVTVSATEVVGLKIICAGI